MLKQNGFIRRARADILEVSNNNGNLFNSWKGIVNKSFNNPQEKVFLGQDIFEYDPENFLYIRARAISGMEKYGPNGNADAFPWVELEASADSFIGKGFFVEHIENSSDDAKGIVLDAVAYPEEQYIECLCAISKTDHPDLCKKIENGTMNSVSMSCVCMEAQCSLCNNVAKNLNELCEHMSRSGKDGSLNTKYVKGSKVNNNLVYEINKKIIFTGLSAVGVPADSNAGIFEVYAKLNDKLSKHFDLYRIARLNIKCKNEKIVKSKNIYDYSYGISQGLIDEKTIDEVKKFITKISDNNDKIAKENNLENSILLNHNEFKTVFEKFNVSPIEIGINSDSVKYNNERYYVFENVEQVANPIIEGIIETNKSEKERIVGFLKNLTEQERKILADNLGIKKDNSIKDGNKKEIMNINAKQVPEEYSKYGVFQYLLNSDENVYNLYFDDKNEAIKVAKDIADENTDSYVEVWERPEDGLWGNTGSPIWKSDEELNEKRSKKMNLIKRMKLNKELKAQEEESKKENKEEKKEDKKEVKETEKPTEVSLGEGVELKEIDKKPKQLLEVEKDGTPQGVFIEPLPEDLSIDEKTDEYREKLNILENEEKEEVAEKLEEKIEEIKEPESLPTVDELETPVVAAIKYMPVEGRTASESLDKSFFAIKDEKGKITLFSAKSIIPLNIQKLLTSGKEDFIETPDSICGQILREAGKTVTQFKNWVKKQAFLNKKAENLINLKRKAVKDPSLYKEWSLREQELEKEEPSKSIALDEKEIKEGDKYSESVSPRPSKVPSFYGRLPSKTNTGDEMDIAMDKKSKLTLGEHAKKLHSLIKAKKEYENKLKAAEDVIKEKDLEIDQLKQEKSLEDKAELVNKIVFDANVEDEEVKRMLTQKLSDMTDEQLQAVQTIAPYFKQEYDDLFNAEIGNESQGFENIEIENGNELINESSKKVNANHIPQVSLDSNEGSIDSEISNMWVAKTLNKNS